MFINKDKSRRSSRRGIQAKEIHNFVVKRSASKGQDEGNHFLKGKLPVPGIVFAGSCGEEPFVVRWILSRRFFKWNCKYFANEPDLQGFSGKTGSKSGKENQCLPDSWSICRLRVWIAPFRDSRCRAAGTRFRVTFCGLADYRPIPRSTKVRPAYRASNVLLKIARNGKSPVPRSIRSTGLKLIWRCQSEWSCSQCLTFAAIPFPGFQTVEFSSSRLQSRRSIPRGFSLSVSSWLVAPFCP